MKNALGILFLLMIFSCESPNGGTSDTVDSVIPLDTVLKLDTVPPTTIVPSDSIQVPDYMPPHQFSDLPVIAIYTESNQIIDSNKVYVPCVVRIVGNGHYGDYFSPNAKVKTRGNSTLKYYPKKPYRIKLAEGAEVLGMAPNKDWVLLANYRDPTFLMNAVAFDMARYLGMEFANTNRFAELYVNDEYLGLYQITEQVEQAKSRVNISKNGGVLYHLDRDDGPELSPQNTDNFYSEIYKLPVNIKYPKNQNPEQLEQLKNDFAILEEIIKNKDYDQLQSAMDVQTLIDFLIIQELTRNVELVSPRSMFMYKDGDFKYHFGPVWDFDGGFAFDWSSMSQSHNYFGSQSWLMGESNPATNPRTAYNKIPGFFVDMFANNEFVLVYQNRWQQVHSGLEQYVMEHIDSYENKLQHALGRNAERWPIDKDHSMEIANLKYWLKTRISAYTSVVNKY
ncbi:MAG: spore coat protein CotH [Fibrobacter sp.]|nr:spore coat protein CotH [Fibrobacter sp.]